MIVNVTFKNLALNVRPTDTIHNLIRWRIFSESAKSDLQILFRLLFWCEF